MYLRETECEGMNWFKWFSTVWRTRYLFAWKRWCEHPEEGMLILLPFKDGSEHDLWQKGPTT